jgi:MYXO-CTERM domain-containing protein
VNGECILGAPRDAGVVVDAASDANTGTTDATVDGDATGTAGSAGTGGSAGAAGTAGRGGGAGSAGKGGSGNVIGAGGSAGVDAGAGGSDAGLTGSDAGKHKAGAVAAKDEGGCGCRVGGARSPSSAWALAGLVVLGLRRVRRPRKAAPLADANP